MSLWGSVKHAANTVRHVADVGIDYAYKMPTDVITNTLTGGHGTDLSNIDNQVENLVNQGATSAGDLVRDHTSDVVDLAGDTYNDLTGETDRRFNAAEADKQRKWEEDQKSKAHQVEVQDLLAAGLNPIQSAGGSDAGAFSSGASAHNEGTAQASQGLLSMGINTVRNVAELKNILSQADLNSAQAGKARAESGKVPFETDNLSGTLKLMAAETDKAIQEKENLIKSGTKTVQEVKNLKEEVKNLRAQRGLIGSQTKLTDTTQQHSALGLKKAEAEADFWSTDYGRQSIWGGKNFLNSSTGTVPYQLHKKKLSGEGRGASGSWIPLKKKGGK